MSNRKKDKNIIDDTINDFISPHASAEKLKKEKKKNKKQIPVAPEDRFAPDLKTGLNNEQIETRVLQNQVNTKGKQYSKSTAKIITSNLFTFFNLLCVLCVIALIIVRATLFNFTFVLLYVVNLSVGIVQELKAKKSIERLSILNAPSATVLRNGKLSEIPVSDIVLDDLVNFSTGNQISVDGRILVGSIEVNESMLTGESVPVKKNVGDTILAGSFVVSGAATAITDKVGEERYIQRIAVELHMKKKIKVIGSKIDQGY